MSAYSLVIASTLRLSWSTNPLYQRDLADSRLVYISTMPPHIYRFINHIATLLEKECPFTGSAKAMMVAHVEAR